CQAVPPPVASLDEVAVEHHGGIGPHVPMTRQAGPLGVVARDGHPNLLRRSRAGISSRNPPVPPLPHPTLIAEMEGCAEQRERRRDEHPEWLAQAAGDRDTGHDPDEDAVDRSDHAGGREHQPAGKAIAAVGFTSDRSTALLADAPFKLGNERVEAALSSGVLIPSEDPSEPRPGLGWSPLVIRRRAESGPAACRTGWTGTCQIALPRRSHGSYRPYPENAGN